MPAPDTHNAGVEKAIHAQTLQRRTQFAHSITRYVGMASAPVMILSLVLWFFFQEYSQLLAFAVFTVPLTVSTLLFPSFRSRGRTTMGINLYLGALLLVLAATPVLVPELLLTAAIAYVVTSATGHLLLGDVRGRRISATCVVAFVADILLVNVWPVRWFTPLEKNAAVAIGAVLSTFAALLGAVLMRMIVLGQEEQFGQAQRARLEIGQRVEAERDQRERLETASVEIERRITAEQAQRGYLQRVLGEVRRAAIKLRGAIGEILTTTTQQAAGANQQSVATAEASTTIDEVRTIARQTAERAEGVADLAQRTTEVSQAGQQAVTDTIGGMARVKEKVESIASNTLALSDQTQRIGQIIATVNEIAAQSNMLALNAAVEAARAGEAGKGFAVVAAEVRTLAEQSQSATKQIGEILSEIQQGVNAAVMATEEGVKGADAGMELAGEAGLAIRRLAESVAESNRAAVQISAAAGQQVTGMEQIGQAVENIHEVATHSVAGARLVEQAVAELNELAAQLYGLVEESPSDQEPA
jgi:methyl-accepting chemotaxis protein